MATDTLPPTADVTPGVTPPPPVPAGKAKPTTPPTDVTADGQDTGATGDEANPEDALAVKKRPFLQTPWVQDVLPLVTSIILHAGIIGIGFATYKTYVAIRSVVEEQVLVPDANIVEGAEVGGIPNPGLGGDPTMSAAQDEMKDVQPQDQNWNTKPSDSLAASLAGAQGETTDNTIGLGPNSAFGSAKGGEGVGAGGEAGGSMAPFGVPGGGGGLGPKNPLFGQTGNIKKIVYVCDATGTMLGLKFELLKQQLKAAIDNHKPIQDFNIIFFRGMSSSSEWSMPLEKRLIKATPANKQKSFKFIDEISVLGNSTNPLPALEQAFQMQPQMIIFLTDGEFNNFASYQEVLAEVDKLNPNRTVRVNTILMMSDDSKAEDTLREMATRNGGNFRKVEEKDLR
jgi:hypothetical protein